MEGDSTMRFSVGVTVICALVMVVMGAVPQAARLSYARYGDFNIGGLFPLHFTDCDSIPTMWSLQQAESMAYTIDRINSRSDLLPNVTLGFDIRDSCRDEDLSLWSALSLIQGRKAECIFPEEFPPCANSSLDDESRKVIGIVGPMTSIASLTATVAADLYEIPMVTFGATSDELSNKERFPYFLRTVPPDSLQAEAMMDLVSYMGWEYVSIIYRADTYGIRGAHALETLAEQRGVCVALSLPVQRHPTDSELENVMDSLREARKARVLLVFAGLATANAVVEAVRNNGMEGHFTWIGSEAWAHGVGRDDSGKLPPLGTIFVLLDNPEPPGYFDYFSRLDRQYILKNPWFEIFLNDWEADNHCTVWVDETCGLPHRDEYTTSSIMSPAIDAVYAFAYGLHSLIQSSDAVNGRNLLKHLRNVSFEEERGRFRFNSEGAVAGKYLLENAQINDGVFEMTLIGYWDALAPERLFFSRDIVWGDGTTDAPNSTCRDVCSTGYRVVPLKQKCCFGCSACDPSAIVFNQTECRECGDTEWPDKNRLSCISIIPAYPKWTSPLQLSTLILSFLGLALVTFVAAGLIWYRNNNVIKATGRELSCVNVLGLSLSYVVPFLLVAKPTSITCCMSQAAFSLSFTLAFASMLLKVSRIYRIFRAGKRSAGRPRFIAPSEQLTIACFLVLIQVICVIISSAVDSCHPRHLIATPRDRRIELYCTLGYGFLVSSAYNLVLILGCCMFAFLARRVPDNYNESKFIGVSVYSTLLACLAAIPVYFTARDASQKVAAISIASLLNAYLTVFCVYVPKLYAVKFLSSSVQSSAEDRLGGSHTFPSVSRSLNRKRVHPDPAGPSAGNFKENCDGLKANNSSDLISCQ